MEHGHHHGERGCCGHGRCGEQTPHGEVADGCRCGHSDEHECCSHGDRDGRLWRRLRSRDERIAQLEAYQRDLQEELKAVGERIAAIRSGKQG